MRLLATYTRVILGIGSLVTTPCSDNSGDKATGSGAKGGSGGAAGNVSGGAAGGGAVGGGTAGSTSDVGIFGNANGEPFSLTERVTCMPLSPPFMAIEASLANDATSRRLMSIVLRASAPGSFDCRPAGNVISYAPAWVPGATSDQYYSATQLTGSCAITLTEVPAASGDSIRGTFTATLELESGTDPAITISNGRFSAKLQ